MSTPGATFAALDLASELAQAIDVLGFTQMTPVQAQALPALLAGKDVIAQARTGSGKTAAFGLALLSRIDVELARVQALVLCPTRELADQVSTELRRLARFIQNLRVVTLCGGTPVRNQLPSLRRAPQVVVGTPGRILDHLRRDSIQLGMLRVLVLDEADRMLDMGFVDDISEVVHKTPPTRQTLLFSATYPNAIRTLSKDLQRQPVEVSIAATERDVEIEQIFYRVGETQKKIDTLTTLLLERKPNSALVFCHTRQDTRDVSEQLDRLGFSALALHGELEQRQREEVLVRFANKSCAVLVATDVAARGLDIKGLDAVISWELSPDPDVHVHRIGRTGRAGEKGLALHLCASREEGRANAIADQRGAPLRWETVTLGASARPTPAPMVTLVVDAGKQDKLRPGDLLGALTGDVGLVGSAVGKIDILARSTYVAIQRDQAEAALTGLRANKIKGRTFRVWRL